MSEALNALAVRLDGGRDFLVNGSLDRLILQEAVHLMRQLEWGENVRGFYEFKGSLRVDRRC